MPISSVVNLPRRKILSKMGECHVKKRARFKVF
jgi:hypothetical protein